MVEPYQVLGATPREQLAALLDRFAYAPDVERWTAAQRRGTYVVLADLVRHVTGNAWTVHPAAQDVLREYDAHGDRAPWRRLPPLAQRALEAARRARPRQGGKVVQRRLRVDAAELLAAQQAVREAVEVVVAGGTHARVSIGRSFRNQGLALRAMGGTFLVVMASWQGEQLVITTDVQASLTDAVVVAALMLVGQVPRSLVRVCPFEEAGARCGRVFVAVKSQKWCVPHREVVRREQVRVGQQRHRARARAAARRRRSA